MVSRGIESRIMMFPFKDIFSGWFKLLIYTLEVGRTPAHLSS
jgi:hypothetical protein